MPKDDKRPPCFTLYVNDFCSDGVVEAMNTEEVGAYFLLLCKAWLEEPCGSIPDDDAIMARWARLTPQRWAKCRPRVLAAFKLTGGRWCQSRMEREYQKWLEQKEKQSKRGSKGAASRWNGASMSQASTKHVESKSETMLSDGLSNSNSNSSNTPTPLDPAASNGGASPAIGFSHAFQMCWDAYPAFRRTKKESADAAWRDSVIRLECRFDGDSRKAEDWLHRRLLEFCKSELAKSEFCPGIAPWLVDGRYDDPSEAWAGDGKSPGQLAPKESKPAAKRVKPVDWKNSGTEGPPNAEAG